MADPRTRPQHDRVALLATVVMLMFCLLLGGGTRQGLAADAWLELLALPLLPWAILRGLRLHESAVALGVFVALAVLAWNLCQLLPLPPAWWTQLPGRSELAAELQQAGVTIAWRPISLDPEATLRATLALLPPLAIGAMALTLSRHARIALLRIVLGAAIASLVLGLAQVAGGPESGLRWHGFTNTHEVVGPFANRNHLAALLVIALPLAVAQIIATRMQPIDPRAPQRRGWALALGLIAIVLLLLGLAVVRSRAGVLLAAVALLPCALMLWRRHDSDEAPRSGLKRMLLGGGVVGVLLAVQFGFWGLLQRFEKDPMADQRWTIAAITTRAADHFGPFGVGAGGFVAAYQSVELPTERSDALINRAHNDWLEWRLEGGVPLAVLLAGALLLLAWRSIAAWRERGPHAIWQRACAIALWLLALHSLADYPLRTTALTAVAALLAAQVLGRAAPHRG